MSAARPRRRRPGSSSASPTCRRCCARGRPRRSPRCSIATSIPCRRTSTAPPSPRGWRATRCRAARVRRGGPAARSRRRRGRHRLPAAARLARAAGGRRGRSGNGADARACAAASRRVGSTRPRSPARFGAHYDPDAFGRLSEGIARFFGTARYLVFQTVLVVSWITIGWLLLRLRRPPVAVPAQPGVLDPGGVRGAADPAGAEPPGRARPAARGGRPDRQPGARRPRPSSWPASWPASRLSLGKIEATLARLEERMERYEESEATTTRRARPRGGTGRVARRATKGGGGGASRRRPPKERRDAKGRAGREAAS